MTFAIHLQIIKELIDITMQIATEIDIEIRTPCKWGTSLIVHVNVWIWNSFDCYETIYLI